jgi:hypothetical protein
MMCAGFRRANYWRASRPGWIIAGLAAGVLAACSPPNSTRLPELASIPRRVLSPQEQQKAMEDLTSVRETHRNEAIKEIQNEGVREQALSECDDGLYRAGNEGDGRLNSSTGLDETKPTGVKTCHKPDLR